MRQPIHLFMVISLTVMVCCACKNPTEEPREIPGEIHQAGIGLTEAGAMLTGFNIQDGICEYMSHFTAEYISDNRMEIDKRPLWGYSAEDGLGEYFSDYRILAINGYLLGGCYNDRWIAWEELYPMMPEENTYKIYVKGQYQGAGPGRKEPESKAELYSGPWIDFQDSEYRFDGYNTVVAYSGSEDIQIESGTAIPLENQLYIDELYKYQLKMGLTEAFELTDILKIDLDDDGQDEVFIQAYHHEDLANESTGIQYMRKVVDGEVESITIPIMAPTVSDDHFTIIGFCDINGDGAKELLMSAMGIGYHDYMVYEFKNNEFTRIFENGGEH